MAPATEKRLVQSPSTSPKTRSSSALRRKATSQRKVRNRFYSNFRLQKRSGVFRQRAVSEPLRVLGLHLRDSHLAGAIPEERDLPLLFRLIRLIARVGSVRRIHWNSRGWMPGCQLQIDDHNRLPPRCYDDLPFP